MAADELVERMNEAFLAVTDLPTRSDLAWAFGPTTPIWVERRLCLQEACRRLRVDGDEALADTLSGLDRKALGRALVFAVGELNESDWREE
jgi:hypothetical protein